MRGAGLYVLRDVDSQVLYVGQSSSLDGRLSAHMTAKGWRNEIAYVETIDCEDETSRMVMERFLIRNLKPLHNKMHVGLPNNEELGSLVYVWTPQWFYDGVKLKYGLNSDVALATYLGVSTDHILLVRLRLMGVTTCELLTVAQNLNVNIYELKSVLPKVEVVKLKPNEPKKPKGPKSFKVPCRNINMEDFNL